MVKLLLEKGAEVDIVDHRGWTPLHNAATAWDDRKEVVKVLLDAGADPNKENATGLCPKYLAYVPEIIETMNNAINGLHFSDILPSKRYPLVGQASNMTLPTFQEKKSICLAFPQPR